LECCGGDIVECQKCAYAKNGYGRCKERAAQEALSLIKQLTQAHEMLSESYDHLEKTKDELIAEKSRLTEVNALQTITLIEFDKQVQRLTEENERLRGDCAKGANALIEEIQKNRTIEADTVREMQHKIWLEFSDCHVEDEICVGSFRASVDQIAKEMLEGE
jgi:hypothetical protein